MAKINGFIILLIYLLAVGCNSNENVDRKIVNGVETITYKVDENFPKKYELKLIEELRIKGAPDENNEFWEFASLGDFYIDDDCYILSDRKDYTIHKFSKSGKLLKSAFLKGRGPGECLSISLILKSGDDYHIYADYPKKKIITLTKDLMFIKDIPINENVFYLIKDTNQKLGYFTLIKMLEKKNGIAKWEKAFHKFTDYNLKDSLIYKQVYTTDNGQQIGNKLIINYQHNTCKYFTDKGEYWISDPEKYVITINGEILRKIKMNVQRYPLNDEDIEKIKSRPQGALFTLSNLKAEYKSFPKFHRVINRIEKVGYEIWVEKFNPYENKKTEIDVYDQEGRLLKSIVIKNINFINRRYLFAKDGYLYLTAENPDDGWEYFVKYKMEYIPIN